ncbi:hypothetical protein [Nocardioides zeae]
MNIRKFVLRAARLDDLVELRSLTPQAAAFLTASVRAGLNVLVAGERSPARPRCSTASPPRSPAGTG